jgi:hypothetical protein
MERRYAEKEKKKKKKKGKSGMARTTRLGLGSTKMSQAVAEPGRALATTTSPRIVELMPFSYSP